LTSPYNLISIYSLSTLRTFNSLFIVSLSNFKSIIYFYFSSMVISFYFLIIAIYFLFSSYSAFKLSIIFCYSCCCYFKSWLSFYCLSMVLFFSLFSVCNLRFYSVKFFLSSCIICFSSLTFFIVLSLVFNYPSKFKIF
jgi:hypothetical protein